MNLKIQILFILYYFLFNQNFAYIDIKNYARIDLGSSNIIPYKVNENLESIILLYETDIDNQIQLFLNIFEKYLISFDILLKKD